MPKTVDISTLEFQDYLWKALQVFNVYRLLLATVLILMQQVGVSTKVLGTVHPTLYLWTISLYLLFGVLVILLLVKRIPGYKASVVLQIILDILVVITMIHASGGLNNGLGVLLAVSVGTSCVFIGSTRALVVPAIATIGLFLEAAFANIHDLHVLDFSQPALLGASFFIISVLSLTLARRLHYSEKIAIDSQAHLASMEAVSDNIIQTLTVGVLIIDEEDNIRLINDAAWKNIGMPKGPTESSLKEISKELYQHLKQWRKYPSNPESQKLKLTTDLNSNELQIRFRKMGGQEHNLVLIFLEDTSLLTQKAQQLKLSSLGRLTASIAHEIRNPLGAISHAAQLLQESETIDASDKDLCDMITKHSKRMNNIIENVMNLSQRRPPQQESIVLNSFLKNYIEELSQTNAEINITFDITTTNLEVQFDRSQLLQVISNLCDNGLRYSKSHSGKSRLDIIGGIEDKSKIHYVDIIDFGPGILESEADNLFEPFYTTSVQGTGLGLYLAREMCEANGARLSYLPIPSGTGSCFRIKFPLSTD
ncbi:MAG: two-component system sensor histidine kinase PilS (NtrC family) [Enterobacterales bacterium]|jgi:two-component system sensor histidine kinase PilS (NtrC family)